MLETLIRPSKPLVLPLRRKKENIEPVSIYKDIVWTAYDSVFPPNVRQFDDKWVEMFDGELGNPAATIVIPRGYRFRGHQLVIYSTSFEQRATYKRQAGGPPTPNVIQDPNVTGYNINEADNEFTFHVLLNGTKTNVGGGANKASYAVDEGEILLPFYKIRMINIFSVQTIDFPYEIEEMENLVIWIVRTSSPAVPITWYNYDIQVTVRLTGNLMVKNVNM